MYQSASQFLILSFSHYLNFKIMKNEVYAAIAMALYEFKGNNVHDKEPGIITIAEKQTQWNGYAQTMTAHP